MIEKNRLAHRVHDELAAAASREMIFDRASEIRARLGVDILRELIQNLFAFQSHFYHSATVRGNGRAA